MTELPIHQDSNVPQKAFVCMFDVLGFSARIAGSRLHTVVDEYRQLIDLKLAASQILVASKSGVAVEVSGTTIFSDTILLWCNDTWEAMQSLFASCAILIATGVQKGWPLRGGIAYGECVLDRQSRTFVGQPIVDAYVTEQSQLWLGAALHQSVLGHGTFGTRIASIDDILEYEVPTKPNCPTLSHAVHWGPYAIAAQSSIMKLNSETSDASAHLKYAHSLKYLQTRCAETHALS